MKKNFIKYTIFTLLATVSMSSAAFAKENTSKEDTNPQMKQLIAKSKQDSDDLIKNWDKLKVKSTSKALKKMNTLNILSIESSESAPNSVGSYGDKQCVKIKKHISFYL